MEADLGTKGMHNPSGLKFLLYHAVRKHPVRLKIDRVYDESSP